MASDVSSEGGYAGGFVSALITPVYDVLGVREHSSTDVSACKEACQHHR